MRYLFDQDDERAVLDELSRNQHKAEVVGRSCIRLGQTKTASRWADSAQQIAAKIKLLEYIFQHKN